MGRVSEYSFISANLRAKISRILDAEFLLKCAEAKDLETLLMTFKDTDFAFLQEVYHKTADIKTCEKEVLDNEIASMKTMVQNNIKSSCSLNLIGG